MPEHIHARQSSDELDELTVELLDCGGVLSQIIGHMVRFEAAGRSAPGAASIPAAAHSLARSTLIVLRRRHSRRDLKIAAAIVKEATEAIYEGILLIPFEDFEDLGTDCDPGSAGE